MTREEQDAVRKLLVRYEAALALAEDLALSLLDALQHDAAGTAAEHVGDRRRAAGDALAVIEAGDAYAKNAWKDLDLERRRLPVGAPLPPTLPKDRRSNTRRRSSG